MGDFYESFIPMGQEYFLLESIYILVEDYIIVPRHTSDLLIGCFYCKAAYICSSIFYTRK